LVRSSSRARLRCCEKSSKIILNAFESGASREEIAEALGVKILLDPGAAFLTHTARAFDAIDSLPEA
jgi:alkylhydroperoxidase/carboxymuconolactone decarboxylase family protein YurZ